MRLGYARVSTDDQRLDLQTDALRNAGCEEVYSDVTSGVTQDKEELDKALTFLRPGDTLVVWRLDRLGRSMSRLVSLINELNQQGIGFVSLVEAIDTTTATGTFFFHVTAAFAELERNLIRERTHAGLAAARARGRKGGRPRAIDQTTFELALRLHEQNEAPVGEICSRLGIAKRTFYRYRQAHLRARQEATEGEPLSAPAGSG